MNVTVSRPTSGELSFAFDADPTDAAAPLPAVWFRHGGVDQMATLRIALMAYLMARPFIGNSFTLSGSPLPAHLASRLHQDFGADEFFVGPVTNVPEPILPDFRYDVLDACAEDESKMLTGEDVSLTCRRNELGYVVEAKSAGEATKLPIATNIDLLAAFTERPALLSLVLMYLCAYDVLGIKCLRARPTADVRWLDRIELLLTEVGGSMYPEPARCTS